MMHINMCNKMHSNMHTLSPHQLRHDVSQLFEHAGVSAQEATEVAANLVLSNSSGHDSHGVGMAPRYIDAIFEKKLIPGISFFSKMASM